jgi:hypothetical protein
MNKALKSVLTLILLLLVSLVQFGCVNAVVDGLEGVNQLAAILIDNAVLTFPFIFGGLYTRLPFHAVDIIASMPFLFMIFFSTTFSPGSGVEGVKELRYLFSRFYWFCILPGVQDSMEGCPSDDVVMLYMFLSGLIGIVLFLVYLSMKSLISTMKSKKAIIKRNALKDDEFRDLQMELFGDRMIDHTERSSHSIRSLDEAVLVP